MAHDVATQHYWETQRRASCRSRVRASLRTGAQTPLTFSSARLHWPAISYSGASTDSSLCVPLTFRTVQLIWIRFGHAQIDLFASPQSTHCQLTKIHMLWRVFVNWCFSQGKDPWRCGIKSVLSFLQGGLDRHLSTSTPKVQVAAISANHDVMEGKSVGKHDLVIRIFRGSRRLNPPRLRLIPSWDLSVVLQALQQDPFEPLQSVNLSALSMKTALLTMLTSVKSVGDLQALSVNDSCLEFGPADFHVVLRPQSGYVPKVPPTPFRDQVVTLQAIPSQEGAPTYPCYAQSVPCAFMLNELRISDVLNSSLSVLEDSKRGRLSRSKGSPTGLWM
ncbi:3-hydroxy-3-methylglutaryl coenzyme A reductase 1 [Labeo rohita]|uniref:3-hydroxy-3-methylglutaryl coenzyme A reductase 1 n=1 Tax=Labeo rohita TaxID=84645 RepID=A0ABQ8L3G2_LABRO|nr:3-hydroxy-3-methylglutaryl coenzyme A reductase 1 [Labeo rohita]